MEKILPTIFHSGIFLLLIYVLIYLLKNPDTILRWSEIYYKYIGFWEKNRNKKIVSSELSYRITNLAKQINKQSEGILPFGLKIKWTTNDEISSTIHNDEIILILKESPNSDKNIVDAFMLFIPKALLPKGRLSIDQSILNTIDLYTIKKMLSTGKYTSAYNYFQRNIIDKKISTHEIDPIKFNGIETADEKGFYERVLLTELKSFSEKYFSTSEETNFVQETLDFFTFIFNIVTRKPGDDSTRLLFLGNTIRIGIVFVAKKDTVESYFGLDSYIHRVDINFNQGVSRVYIFAHALITEETEIDPEGFVINVFRKASFKYMDYIEKQLLQNRNYLIKKTDTFSVKINGYDKMTKLLIVEKRDPTIETEN
jgi:small subunit ribosomal protein S1